MLEYILDTSKKLDDSLEPMDIHNFINEFCNDDNKYNCTTIPAKATIFHQNYMEYLEKCWGSHYGVIVRPDILWYTLLCEITQIIHQDPDVYSHLFSDHEEKTDITIRSDSMVIMPLDVLISSLSKLVPINTDPFLIDFSTSTDRSRHACYAAFADMCSPYYNYSMYRCGIPKIRVDGTMEDYEKILINWNILGDVMRINNEYFQRVQKILTNIITSIKKYDLDFWQDIFQLEQCGSGHQVEVCGWWKDLYYKLPNVQYVCNFSSHVSVVSYTQLNTQKKYSMKDGLFHSIVDDAYLVPDYSSVITENN